jgi:hypothetical protein
MIGVIPAEPAVTPVVAAGSVIFCDSAPADAGACGVAFRATLRRPDGTRRRLLGGGHRTCGTAVHDVLEMVLARHQVVLGRHLGGVAEPLGHGVGWMAFNPVGLARGPKVLEQAVPRLVARLQDDPAQLRAEVRPRSRRHQHDQGRPRFGAVEGSVPRAIARQAMGKLLEQIDNRPGEQSLLCRIITVRVCQDIPHAGRRVISKERSQPRRQRRAIM